MSLLTKTCIYCVFGSVLGALGSKIKEVMTSELAIFNRMVKIVTGGSGESQLPAACAEGQGCGRESLTWKTGRGWMVLRNWRVGALSGGGGGVRRHCGHLVSSNCLLSDPVSFLAQSLHYKMPQLGI